MAKSVKVRSDQAEKLPSNALVFVRRQKSENKDLTSRGRAEAVASHALACAANVAHELLGPDAFSPLFDCDSKLRTSLPGIGALTSKPADAYALSGVLACWGVAGW